MDYEKIKKRNLDAYYQKNYYEKYKEIRKIRCRAFYLVNRVKILERQRIKRIEKKEQKILEQQKIDEENSKVDSLKLFFN